MEIIKQFNFLELLLLASSGLFLLILILSIFRFVKLREKGLLVFRHLAGFVVGLLDQTCMVFFNFQQNFLGIVVLFNYAAYSFWFLLTPNFFKFNRKYFLICVWILGSAAINTTFEHISLLTIVGSLNYPTKPIVWTSLHTFVFYTIMHGIGILMLMIGFYVLKAERGNFKKFSICINQ